MMKIRGFEVNLFGEITYIVWDETSREAAIIDPGMSDEREQHAVAQFIEREGLTLRHLLYTHLHVDHTFGHDFVVENYGLTPRAHVGDAEYGRGRDVQADMFHLRVGALSPIEITEPLRDGDTIHLGGDYLKVICVPGHSQGSVAFYSPSGGFVVTGDALFHSSIGRTDLPGGNQEQLIRSIRQQLLTLPDNTIVYPGHGTSSSIGREKRFNHFLI